MKFLLVGNVKGYGVKVKILASKDDMRDSI
jgi:hypothetical protein